MAKVKVDKELIGKRVTRADGTKDKIVAVTASGYKMESGGRQIKADKIAKKGRGLIEVVDEPETPTRKRAAKKTKRVEKPKPVRRKREEPEEEEEEQTAVRRKPKKKEQAKPDKKPKSGIRRRQEEEQEEEEEESNKKPVTKFTKKILEYLRAQFPDVINNFLKNECEYDLELRLGYVEARYNNADDTEDRSLDGPLTRISFDLIPANAKQKKSYDLSSLKFDEKNKVLLASLIEDTKTYDKETRSTLIKAFNKLAKTDPKIGSFEARNGIRHIESDALYVLIGYDEEQKKFIVAGVENGEVKRMSRGTLVNDSEYVDLHELSTQSDDDEQDFDEEDMKSDDDFDDSFDD